MDDVALKYLDGIDSITDFVDFVGKYYPGMNIKTLTEENIEKGLFHTFIKIIGKIMRFSPQNMRFFLKNYLMKFEIDNIKQIVLGTIIGIDRENLKSNINFLVETYLENTEFIEDLIQLYNLEELQYSMRGSRYYEAIREGLLYYRTEKDVFVLIAFLDRIYYSNLVRIQIMFNKTEKALISLYIKYMVEIYNLNIIFRGIKNNIDKKLLQQLIVGESLFFDYNLLYALMQEPTVDDFLNLIIQYLENNHELRSLFIPVNIDPSQFRWSLEKLYIEYYFKRFKLKAADIDYMTIYKIFEVLIKKEKEIRLEIIPRIMDLFYSEFKKLKD